MARYTSKQTTVTLEDSSGVYSMTVGPGDGDFNVDNLIADNSEKTEVRDRGVHDGFVEGADLVQNWSVTVRLKNEAITNAAADRILDAMRKTGLWAAATSVDSTVWAFKLTVTMNDGSVSSTITLPKCVGMGSLQEGADGHTLSLSGTNHLAPTYAAV